MYIYASGTITLHNNIVWGNAPNQTYQTFGGSFSASYNDIQNGSLAGTGNIDVDPALIGEFLYLTTGSPCTDAGDPGVAFYDPEDPSAPGSAIWPATGTLTNDLGAYGGPLSFTLEPVSFFADTTIGWAPLEVAFTPIYGYTVNSWSWDFGDGDGATVENPVHTFTTGGQFDVSVDAGTDTGTKSRIKTKYISILADTLIGIDAEGDAGGDVEVTVNARNNVPVSKIRLPFEYGGGDFSLTFDSFSTAGCRTAAFDTVAHIFADVFGHRDVLSIYNYNSSTPDLEAGYGPIIKLYFSIPNPASGSVTLTYDGFMSYLPIFYSPLLTYNPVVNTSTVSTSFLCGDASGDGDVNLIDILYLISYKYDVPPGPEPMPLAAGDANGDGAINLVDILYLIDYRYGTPPGPDPLCP